jgi:nucleotidyltransferase substrate binding protein (TIGR01987 family)
MDKDLELKKRSYNEALASLRFALKQRKSKIVRDSVIKRFEYSFELCWKTAKLFVLSEYGADSFSPKETFRELRRNQLIDDGLAELLIKMVNDRNEIIHTYNEKSAEELYQRVALKYFRAMEQVRDLIR